MSFDTTASNTGVKNGACHLIEKKLGRNLIGLACRHHVHELLVSKAFKITVEKVSSGPDILLFQKFKNFWPKIDKKKYENGVDDKEISSKLASEKDDILLFIKSQLSVHQPRDDYKELLQLCSIFLGVKDDEWTFHAPGAHHRARWMMTIIYSFKIYLFRGQFDLQNHELKGIKQFLLFVCKIYIFHWYLAPNAASAPNNDLLLNKKLENYKDEPKMANEVKSVLMRHLWYLTEDLARLAIFDDNVDINEKLKIVQAFKKRGSKDCNTKINKINSNDNISNFVSIRSKNIFKILNLDDSFLNEHPSLWHLNTNYINNQLKVSQLKVVNDTAERGVALAETYNKTVTTEETQQQCLLQVVEEHRAIFPNTNKETIKIGLKKQMKNY